MFDALLGTCTAKRLARLPVVAVVAIVILGACSVTEYLDVANGEKVIKTQLEDKLGTPVQDVSCPEREIKQGDVFECTAQVDGQSIRIRGTQDDDQGNVTFTRAQAIIMVADAVAFVEQELGTTTNGGMKADCGPQRILVKDPDTTFDCQVTKAAGGASLRAIVTVRDVDGTVDLALA